MNRVKLIIEEIEREEAVLLEDLNSMDRKFAEHYNVCSQKAYKFLYFFIYFCIEIQICCEEYTYFPLLMAVSVYVVLN